jgi:hypothetical protein
MAPKVEGEERANVGDARRLPKRSQLHAQPTDAVVQVLAEASGCDLFLQRPIRGEDELHVDWNFLRAAYGLHTAAFENTEKQRLVSRN